MTGARRERPAFEARVVASYGRHHLVESDAAQLYEAQRRGKRGDVVIGDRVQCTATAPAQAVIESIAPRASLLMRADGARTKALAANVELLVIVFAPRPACNEQFIWRALIAARAAGIADLALLNKTDLDHDGEGGRIVARLAALGHPTLAVSAKTDPEPARRHLLERIAGRTSLLVGQSGMGKSTLINLLVPQANARTQTYSQRLNLGRQTTTASRMFALPEGGAIIDTPGFQAFGLAHLRPDGIAASLPEFAPHLGRCRFNDCRHLEEPDCAIRSAVAAGAIDTERYRFYAELARAPR